MDNSAQIPLPSKNPENPKEVSKFIDINITPDKVYAIAIMTLILVVFGGFIFVASSNPTKDNGDISSNGSPAPEGLGLAKVGGIGNQDVKGATTNQKLPPAGPNAPKKTPSPSPKPTESPSQSPSPTNSPTPSPSPTNQPNNSSSSTSPDKPSGLNAVASCADNKPKIALTWNAPSNTNSYKVYRDGSEKTSGHTSTSYDDTNDLNADTDYTYKVKAVNSSGDSPESDPVTIKARNDCAASPSPSS